MRSKAQVAQIRGLAESGVGAAAIARRTGIPRTTVRDWLARGEYRAPRHRRTADLSSLPPAAYAYLLGLYLGDGHVATLARSYRLTITLDARYPGIVEEAAAAVGAVLPANTVAVRPTHCIAAWSCRSTPSCGRSSSHSTDPAASISGRSGSSRGRPASPSAPRALLRGLIHSDGSRYDAVVRRHGRSYRYTRDSFSNRSDDIKAIFCAHLDLLGIGWTRPNANDIAVARRAARRIRGSEGLS